MIGEILALVLGAMSTQAVPPPGLDDATYARQRRRVMALVADGDCSGAHGAVFVMADRPMLELVESVCPMGALDVARWDTWNHDEFVGMATEAQIATSHRIADGDDVPVVEGEQNFDAPTQPPKHP